MKRATHPWLKLGVIVSVALIALVGWLSFWVCGTQDISLTAFITQITQADSPSFWQWSRVLGIIGYSVLWLSVMTGLSISSQSSQFWFERGTALSWHQFFTWLGLLVSLLHAGTLLNDSYLAPSLLEIAVPFMLDRSDLPMLSWLWIGLGQVAWYAMLLIAVGSLFKQKIAKTAWRYLHAFALAAYVSTVAHGLFVGTDNSQLWLQGWYLVSNLLLMTVVLFRILQLKLPQAKPQKIAKTV